MDENEDPLELERKIAQASRISSRITDQTTYERLRAWAEELRQRLGQRLAARRTRKRLERAPTNFGNRMDGQQTATWSSGFRPRLKLPSVIGSDRMHQYWPLGRVPERLNLSIQFPKVHVAVIYDLLRQAEAIWSDAPAWPHRPAPLRRTS